jgi:hypothetical protein
MSDFSESNVQIPDRVFQIWNHRKKIEFEAAHLFTNLGQGMRGVWGEHDPIAALCFKSAEDELRHVKRCQMILELGSKDLPPLQPELIPFLGPRELSPSNQILYTSVALGCVTETLSTALLLRMHQVAQDGIIKETIHEILEDEITHSRIGWAELARASQQRDVSWLKPYIKEMIHVAIRGDVQPMTAISPHKNLSSWGILPFMEAKTIMDATIQDVVLPGLGRYLSSLDDLF